MEEWLIAVLLWIRIVDVLLGAEETSRARGRTAHLFRVRLQSHRQRQRRVSGMWRALRTRCEYDMTMPKRSRIRRILKWAGAGMCVLILLSWVVSLRWTPLVKATNRVRVVHVGIETGCLCLDIFRSNDMPPAGRLYYDFGVPRGAWIRRNPSRLAERIGLCWPGKESVASYTCYVLPLWLPWVMFAAPTALLFHRERRIASRTIGPKKQRIRVERLSSEASLVISAVIFAASLIVVPFLLEAVFSTFLSLVLAWQTAGLVAVMSCSLLIPYLVTRTAYLKLRWRLIETDVPHCTSCGYNLTGNLSGVCSECGTKIAAG